jgi:hypothetical protein
MATEPYACDVMFVGGEQEGEVSFHFKLAGVTTSDTIGAGQALVEIFVDNFLPLLLDLLPTNYSVVRIIARRLLPIGSAYIKEMFNRGTQPGTVSGGAAAGQVCPAVRLVPAMGGTSINRFFLPVAPAAYVIDNAYNGTYVTAVAALVNGMISGASSSGITATLAVWSPKHQTVNDVAAHNLSAAIGFQRRRIIPL